MASTFQSAKAKTGVPARAGLGICSVSGTYTFLAALVDEDVIEMVKIPAGATVLDFILDIPATGLDTGTAIVWALGDGDSEARYMTGAVQGRSSAGAIVRAGSTGAVVGSSQLQYAAEDTIDFKVKTAPTTGVAVGTMKRTVFYTMDA
jgi:hypothetical protein